MRPFEDWKARKLAEILDLQLWQGELSKKPISPHPILDQLPGQNLNG